MNSGNLGAVTRPSRRKRYSVVVKTLPMLLTVVLLAGCGGGGGGSSTTGTTGTGGTGTTGTGGTTGSGGTGTTGTGGTGTTGTGGTGSTGTLPAAAQSVSAPALSNFTAILSEDVKTISVGGTVNYTVALTNTTAVAATIITDTVNSTNVPKATLRITGSSGQTVYPPPAHPLDSPPPPPGSTAVTVQPGQSLFETIPLSVFSKADTYQAVATFTVASNSTDTPQTVTLTALPVTVK